MLPYHTRLPSIVDLKHRARKRMPRFAFDYVDAAIDQEHGKRRNRDAWHAVELTPRYLRDVSETDLRARLFGRDYALPFGVAPVGLGDMMWAQAEPALARAAQHANIPYVLSTFSTTDMAHIAQLAPQVCWFQLYVPKKIAVMDDLLRRAKHAGYHALVVTLDIPVGAKRNRELKNDLKLPFQLTANLVNQCMRRPMWTARMLRYGAPDFVNVARYRKNKGEGLAAFITDFNMHGVTLERLKMIRAKWDGALIIKGVQHPDDMRACAQLGADGLIVSNHGGRQLDAAPPSAHSLRVVPEEVRRRVCIMVDGGVRTGLDVVRAKALGAQMTFSGRAFFWGIGAMGARGAHQVIEIFRDEINRTLKQLGCESFARMNHQWLSGEGEADEQ